MTEIGGFTVLEILVRTLGYAGGLLAVGSALFLILYGGRRFPRSAPDAARRVMRRAVWAGGVAAAVAILATLASVGVRAGRLSGMGIEGMGDPMILGIVLDGPVGLAVAIRLAALVAVAASLLAIRSVVGRALAALAALTYAASYAFAGHATEEPAGLLAIVLTMHLVAVAFWIGAFVPLADASRRLAAPDAAALLEAFGRAAVVGVGILVAAGATFAYVLLETPAGLLASAYGRILMVKLAIVTALLALAALNKFALVPALEAGDERARTRLVRSIRLEAVAVVAILTTTAVLTAVATPPSRAVAAIGAS